MLDDSMLDPYFLEKISVVTPAAVFQMSGIRQTSISKTFHVWDWPYCFGLASRLGAAYHTMGIFLHELQMYPWLQLMPFLNFYKLKQNSVHFYRCIWISLRLCTILHHWNKAKSASRESVVRGPFHVVQLQVMGPQVMMKLFSKRLIPEAFPCRLGMGDESELVCGKKLCWIFVLIKGQVIRQP